LTEPKAREFRASNWSELNKFSEVWPARSFGTTFCAKGGKEKKGLYPLLFSF
jgi:hypothetical protein